MFVRSSNGSLVNLDHVAVAEMVESRGSRAFRLRDSTGRELGVVREADLMAAAIIANDATPSKPGATK